MSTHNNLQAPPDFGAPQIGGTCQGPRTHALPICPLLRIYDLRSGLETLIVLAWLSEEERVREVAARWSWLTQSEKWKVGIKTLCLVVRVEPVDFIRAVAGTAWELGIEFPLQFGIDDVRSYVQQVEYELWLGPALAPIPTVLYAFGEEHRRRNRRVICGEPVRTNEDHAACDTFAAIREEWRLSQAQFANLLMTSERTVRRWEDHMYAPTPNQRWLMDLRAA